MWGRTFTARVEPGEGLGGWTVSFTVDNPFSPVPCRPRTARGIKAEIVKRVHRWCRDAENPEDTYDASALYDDVEPLISALEALE